MRLKYSLFSLVALSMVTFVPCAMATAVTGTATFSGNATVNSNGVFFNDTGANVTNPYVPGSPDTKDFGGLTSGTIKNLVGPAMTGNVSISDFATFNVGIGTIDFDLTKVEPGVGTAGGCSSSAVGSTCTPPNSPFTLIQTAPNAVAITLTLDGRAWIASPAGETNAVGAFTTQDVTIGKIPNILSTLLSGGSIRDTYSASFTVTAPGGPNVPEPATMLLMGVGLLGAGLVARRKAAK